MDPVLPILSILGYWAIILGSFGGPLPGPPPDPMRQQDLQCVWNPPTCRRGSQEVRQELPLIADAGTRTSKEERSVLPSRIDEGLPAPRTLKRSAQKSGVFLKLRF